MRQFLSSFLAIWIIFSGCVPIDRSLPNRETYISTGYSAASREISHSFLIRVAICIRQPSVRLAAPETFVMTGIPMGGTTIGGQEKRYREAVLTSEKLFTHKAYIEPLGDGQITVNGKKYRGSMEIIEDGKGALTVINELDLEDYVMGVIAGEVPQDWPLEALKAQAIAARTFAVLKRTEARKRGDSYDLENTSFFQVYQGTERVNENIVKAVAKTRHEIATFKNAPIMAFFHSNCGGCTSKAVGVWSQNQPYLQPVSCPFGNNGPHFRWRSEVPIPDMVRKLRSYGMNLSDIVRVSIVERDESERILQLSIMDADGQTKKMKGSVFRMALGPDVIRSTRFDAVVQGNKVIFNGKGWGHGVGLCQEGACAMAYKGYSCFEILRYYYHGILTEKLKND